MSSEVNQLGGSTVTSRPNRLALFGECVLELGVEAVYAGGYIHWLDNIIFKYGIDADGRKTLKRSFGAKVASEKIKDFEENRLMAADGPWTDYAKVEKNKYLAAARAKKAEEIVKENVGENDVRALGLVANAMIGLVRSNADLDEWHSFYGIQNITKITAGTSEDTQGEEPVMKDERALPGEVLFSHFRYANSMMEAFFHRIVELMPIWMRKLLPQRMSLPELILLGEKLTEEKQSVDVKPGLWNVLTNFWTKMRMGNRNFGGVGAEAGAGD